MFIVTVGLRVQHREFVSYIPRTECYVFTSKGELHEWEDNGKKQWDKDVASIHDFR